MKRREFVTILGGAAAWPLAARAQQRERVRRIGVLANLAADDPEGQARLTAFTQGLQELGWTVGRNVSMMLLWGIPMCTAIIRTTCPQQGLFEAAVREIVQVARETLPPFR